MSFLHAAKRIGLGVGCVIFGLGTSVPQAQAAKSAIASYIVLGPDGARIARVVTDAPSCPAITVDGKTTPMSRRAPAETVPQRATASTVELSKASVFSAQVCETTIPADEHEAEIGGIRLPLPPASINRIVVIGDTGCRIKASANAVQDCNDKTAYPFQMVARAAAAWKPDLVLHVGDYLYREDPCPANRSGCAATPWGYGSDSWNADFFEPGEALLRAAPWVMTRGNHETCDRAGQGWQRFFDPYAFTAARSCDVPENDMKGNFTPPFAVPLGHDTQIIVWDTSVAPTKHFSSEDPEMAVFGDQVRQIATLALRAHHNFLAVHQPPLGFSAKRDKDGGTKLIPSILSTQDVLAKADPALFPANLDLILSGHVHLWQQLSFGGRYPSQIISGFSGTQEETVPVPETLPPNSEPFPGAAVDAFSSWIQGFGFMTLERQGDGTWLAEVHDKNGFVVNRCQIHARLSHCERPQVHAS